MDDLFIPLWPPACVEDYTLSDEQLVAAGEDVKLMSAVRSDQRLLLSVSWPGGRRYLMIDPNTDGAPEAFRAGARRRTRISLAPSMRCGRRRCSWPSRSSTAICRHSVSLRASAGGGGVATDS